MRSRVCKLSEIRGRDVHMDHTFLSVFSILLIFEPVVYINLYVVAEFFFIVFLENLKEMFQGSRIHDCMDSVNTIIRSKSVQNSPNLWTLNIDIVLVFFSFPCTDYNLRKHVSRVYL